MRVLNQTTRGSACTRVLTREIGACDTCIARVSHAFTVELATGLYRTSLLESVVTFKAVSIQYNKCTICDRICEKGSYTRIQIFNFKEM